MFLLMHILTPSNLIKHVNLLTTFHDFIFLRLGGRLAFFRVLQLITIHPLHLTRLIENLLLYLHVLVGFIMIDE